MHSIYMINFRVLYENLLRIEHNYLSWDKFLEQQEKNCEYATTLFIQATAVLSGVDICITSEISRPSDPYVRLSRSWEPVPES